MAFPCSQGIPLQTGRLEFLPLTSTEAKCVKKRNGEWENKQDDLEAVGRAAKQMKQDRKRGKCHDKTVRCRVHGGGESKRLHAQLHLEKMFYSFLTLFSH